MAMQDEHQYSERARSSKSGYTERLAGGLGWLSIGLGLAEIMAPGVVARLIGIEDRPERRSLLRVYGFREIAAGIGILSGSRPAGWVWSRVAGDLIDLVSLGSAMSYDKANRTRAATATAAVVAVTALDVYCGRQLSRNASQYGRTHMTKTIIINRSSEEVYSFWHDFESFPRFIEHLVSVKQKGHNLWHWKTKAPAGRSVEWDAEIVRDQPSSFIAWRSVEGSDIDISGSVHFQRATGGRGTLLRVELDYVLPGGAIGSTIARVLGAEPGQRVENALRLLKQVLETGDVVRSDTSIYHDMRMHPARPPEELLEERGPEELSLFPRDYEQRAAEAAAGLH